MLAINNSRWDRKPEKDPQIVQEDFTWGPSGIIAWTAWPFPIPLGLFTYAAFDVFTKLIPQWGQGGREKSILLISVFVGMASIYIGLSGLSLCVEAWWVARKLTREGDHIKVVRYFYPSFTFNLKEVERIETFYISKFRRLFSLLNGRNDPSDRKNYRVVLKDGRTFLLNGKEFDPYAILARD